MPHSRGRRVKRSLNRVFGLPSASLVESVLRRSRLRAGVVLLYHGVGSPGGDPERELVPALETSLFESHLRLLSRRYRVVPLSELATAAGSRRPGERFPVAITLDDDLPSHAEVAMPALQRAGLSACFFVGGASLLEPRAFWWERLQWAVDRGLVDRVPGLPEAIQTANGRGRPRIFELASAFFDLAPAERERVAEVLKTHLGPDPARSGLRATDLRRLAEAGFEVGFHTLRHHSLPQLTDEELELALREGREHVAAVAGKPLDFIAYPHGEWDGRVAAAARRAAFRAGFTAIPRAFTPADDALAIGRVEASHSSMGRFSTQLVLALIRASVK